MDVVKVVYGAEDKLEPTSVTASYGETNLASPLKNSYKYAENKIIADFVEYIDKTYDEHYMTENDVQCFDAWIALGDATPSFRNTAMKYLWRYGKKSGNNKDDLMKTLHYTLMCLYNDHYRGK
jgi:hypothetical protein